MYQEKKLKTAQEQTERDLAYLPDSNMTKLEKRKFDEKIKISKAPLNQRNLKKLALR